MSGLLARADTFGAARLLAAATAAAFVLILAAFVLAVATGPMEKKAWVAAVSILAVALALGRRARPAGS